MSKTATISVSKTDTILNIFENNNNMKKSIATKKTAYYIDQYIFNTFYYKINLQFLLKISCKMCIPQFKKNKNFFRNPLNNFDIFQNKINFTNILQNLQNILYNLKHVSKFIHCKFTVNMAIFLMIQFWNQISHIPNMQAVQVSH